MERKPVSKQITTARVALIKAMTQLNNGNIPDAYQLIKEATTLLYQTRIDAESDAHIAADLDRVG